MPAPATRPRPWQPGGLRRVSLRDGYAGTVQTLQEMAQIAREQRTSPQLRRRAAQILAQLPPRSDGIDVLQAVWDFVTSSILYVRDPIGVEWITDPEELDLEIDEANAFEDCESIELYVMTLLASIGILSAFEIQAKDEERPGVFTHCALRVRVPRSTDADGVSWWIAFDPVGFHYFADFQLGDSLQRPGEAVELWSIDGERIDPMLMRRGAAGGAFGAAFGDAGQATDHKQKTATGTAPQGMSTEDIIGTVLNTTAQILPYAGPVGGIVGGLITVGENIFDAATGSHMGQPPPGGKVAVSVLPVGAQIVPSADAGAKGGGKKKPPPAPSDDGSDGGGTSSSLVPAAAGAGLALLVLRSVL